MRSAIRAAAIESEVPSCRGADNSLVASLRSRGSRHFQAVRKGGVMMPIFNTEEISRPQFECAIELHEERTSV